MPIEIAVLRAFNDAALALGAPEDRLQGTLRHLVGAV
jgi:hypothetical protein